ncbi:MAG: carbohydrate ABC transporter permease [Candidatus Helarchaeota archaeon]|nr:carbohydrate ABC transporter permease [Candidatus Helarchaeota archaeon]
MTRKVKKAKIMEKIILCVFIFIILFPIIWIGINSLKYPRDILSAHLFLFKPTLKNYISLFFEKGSYFPMYMVNSLIIATSSTFLCIVIGSLAAYSFSRFKFPGNFDKYIFALLLFTQMIFPIALAIPFYSLMNALKVYDTVFAVIGAHTAINIPFAIWMLKSSFDGLPENIEEAARIDGCSWLQVLTKVALPLVAPGMAASAIFVFILSWNDYLFPAVLTSSRGTTMPVGLALFVQENIVKWGNICAGATFYMIPMFLLTVLIHKHLIKGFTLGAFKG